MHSFNLYFQSFQYNIRLFYFMLLHIRFTSSLVPILRPCKKSHHSFDLVSPRRRLWRYSHQHIYLRNHWPFVTNYDVLAHRLDGRWHVAFLRITRSMETGTPDSEPHALPMGHNFNFIKVFIIFVLLPVYNFGLLFRYLFGHFLKCPKMTVDIIGYITLKMICSKVYRESFY